MRSVTVIILHACATLALAKESAANHNGMEQNLADEVAVPLIDRAMSTPIHDANLDATTLAKTHAGTAVRTPATMNHLPQPVAGTTVRTPATMNRLPLPVTSGQMRFGPAGAPVNRRALGKVQAGTNENILASRYADALMDVVEEEKAVEPVREDLASLSVALQVPELMKLLSNPLAPNADRVKLIDGILKHPSSKKFCSYLVDNQRIDLAGEIIEAFEESYASKMGIQLVTLTSACEMTEEQQFKIAKYVKDATGCKSVKIKTVIEPELIGGFTVQFGPKLIDQSIRGKLDGIRKHLLTSLQ